MKERRKFRRWDCVIRCRCEGENLRLNGVIVNLSYGGTEMLVTIGPRWNRIQLHSRVVWVEPEGQKRGYAQFGVEFLGSLQERQGRLAYFLPK